MDHEIPALACGGLFVGFVAKVARAIGPGASRAAATRCVDPPHADLRSTGQVTFGFWNGKRLADPERVLEGAGGRMRHLKLRRWDEVPAQVLRARIARAAAIDRA